MKFLLLCYCVIGPYKGEKRRAGFLPAIDVELNDNRVLPENRLPKEDFRGQPRDPYVGTEVYNRLSFCYPPYAKLNKTIKKSLISFRLNITTVGNRESELTCGFSLHRKLQPGPSIPHFSLTHLITLTWLQATLNEDSLHYSSAVLDQISPSQTFPSGIYYKFVRLKCILFFDWFRRQGN